MTGILEEPQIAEEDVVAAVTLINSFEVPAGREDEFFGLWKQVNALICGRSRAP